MSLKKIVAAVGAAVVMAAVGVVGFAAPASAHDATLSAAVECQTDGSAIVTWTVTNDYNEVATIIDSDNAAIPVGSKISAAVNGNTFEKYTQHVAAPAAGKSASAALTVQWSDSYTQSVHKSITIGSTCVATDDATADVKVISATCDTPGSAEVTDLKHAKLEGTLDTSPGTHTATFTAKNNHTFPGGKTTKTVTYTVEAAGNQNTNPGGTCYKPLKDATASVTVGAADCGIAGVPSAVNVVNATLNGTLDTSVGTHTATFTAKTGHVFADGSTTHTVSYTVPAGLPDQNTNPGGDCYVPHQDAEASVTIVVPQCGVAGTATTRTQYATLDGTLDTSVGTHTATFTAASGHVFADGTKTKTVEYTIAAGLPDQNTNPGGDCYVPHPDADASVDTTPAKCGIAGTATTADVAFATLNGELDTTPGTHTATFTAVSGHVFADGATTKTVDYTVPAGLPDQKTNPNEPCYVAPEAPSLAGSVATGRCVADAPWIFYDVTVTNPDDVPLTGHDVKLVLTDGTHTADVALGTIPGNSGHISGKVLWPGAAVAADGVTPTAWPGWSQMSDGTWVMVPGNYGWTRSLTAATLEVNPSLSVALSYPPATPNCVDAPVNPTAAKTTGSGLADTGSNVVLGGLAGALALLIGGAFVTTSVIRRRRSTEG